ncbi:MAG: 3-phosphoshikimate 1-carboxyvinyltransferase [Candidatus Cyclobacteriaceae bacterium M3_2C_046]
MSGPKFLNILQQQYLNPVNIQISSSKSESNRALIVNALTGNRSVLHNLSDARDTWLMQSLLKSEEKELDVMDAGTTMRFLTAYFAVTNQEKILKGTPRMHERPIKVLVEALRQIGANIDYLKNEGYPPLHVRGLAHQQTHQIKIRGDISSQYISALLMIAPVLPKGLTLELSGNINSRPYIDMTLQLMARFKVEAAWVNAHTIQVPAQNYQETNYLVESDWSGASYWYSLVSLAKQGKVKLLGLKPQSFQGDQIIKDQMALMGVHSHFDADGVWLEKAPAENIVEFDFSGCPDLAQTVAVTCAAKRISCKMTGLESLRIKETDRLFALENELIKIGASLQEENGSWSIVTGNYPFNNPRLMINTYEDHRMAMAFAPLATMTSLLIENPAVVNKSYPGFWQDLQKAGFELIFE